MSQLEEHSALETARQEGTERGLKEGIEQGIKKRQRTGN